MKTLPLVLFVLLNHASASLHPVVEQDCARPAVVSALVNIISASKTCPAIRRNMSAFVASKCQNSIYLIEGSASKISSQLRDEDVRVLRQIKSSDLNNRNSIFVLDLSSTALSLDTVIESIIDKGNEPDELTINNFCTSNGL